MPLCQQFTQMDSSNRLAPPGLKQTGPSTPLRNGVPANNTSAHNTPFFTPAKQIDAPHTGPTSSTTSSAGAKTSANFPSHSHSSPSSSSPSSSSSNQKPNSGVPTGKWEHPGLAEIRKRSVSKEVVFAKVLNNSIILAVISVAAKFASKVPYLSELVATKTSGASGLALYARIAYIALASLCFFNIVSGLRVLLTPRDSFENIPMTPAQRELLNLPQSPRASISSKNASTALHAPSNGVYTPPRYPRSPVNISSASSTGAGSPSRNTPYQQYHTPAMSWRGTGQKSTTSTTTSSSLRPLASSAAIEPESPSFASPLASKNKSYSYSNTSSLLASPLSQRNEPTHNLLNSTTSTTTATKLQHSPTFSPSPLRNSTSVLANNTILSTGSPYAKKNSVFTTDSAVQPTTKSPEVKSLGRPLANTSTTPSSPFSPSAKFMYMSESNSPRRTN